jgi:hypothetical protein
LFGNGSIGQIAKLASGARDCEFQDWDTILIPEDDRISFYRRRSIDALHDGLHQ